MQKESDIPRSEEVGESLFSFRVGSCDSWMVLLYDIKDDPRNHTNQHEQKTFPAIRVLLAPPYLWFLRTWLARN